MLVGGGVGRTAVVKAPASRSGLAAQCSTDLRSITPAHSSAARARPLSLMSRVQLLDGAHSDRRPHELRSRKRTTRRVNSDTNTHSGLLLCTSCWRAAGRFCRDWDTADAV